MRNILRYPGVHLLLLALCSMAVYLNSFDVPFLFDDRQYIVENPLMRCAGFFVDPSSVNAASLPDNVRTHLMTRYVGYLSFFLNYQIHGLEVFGYHLVNLLLHIADAFLVYWLFRLILRTPHLSTSWLRPHAPLIALLSALIFAAHPVQTQAVTYVSQRFTALAALFYLLCLCCYAAARLSDRRVTRFAMLATALVSAVAAVHTKENAFTLPLALVMFEVVFLTGPRMKRAFMLGPFLLTLLIIPLHRLLAEGLTSAMQTPSTLLWYEYLLTQPRVLLTYLRLLALPVGQNLDYDYPVPESFLAPEIFFSSLLITGLLATAIYRLCLCRQREPSWRIVGFGLAWFFLTLSVESSIIPLADVINEHRLYLPSVGLISSVVTALILLAGRAHRNHAVAVLAIMILVFSLAAYNRNTVWQTRITLWSNVVEKSPGKARPHNNLGNAYLDNGSLRDAVREFQTAIAIRPDYSDAHFSLGVAYRRMGAMDEAAKEFRQVIRYNPRDADTYNELGVLAARQGRVEEAIALFKKALSVNPAHDMAAGNLSRALSQVSETK